MFVCGTTSNVDVISPLVGGGGFGSPGLIWIVTVPRQVPITTSDPTVRSACPRARSSRARKRQESRSRASRVSSYRRSSRTMPSASHGSTTNRSICGSSPANDFGHDAPGVQASCPTGTWSGVSSLRSFLTYAPSRSSFASGRRCPPKSRPPTTGLVHSQCFTPKIVPLILPVFVRSTGALEALSNTTMRVPNILSSPDASLKSPVPPLI